MTCAASRRRPSNFRIASPNRTPKLKDADDATRRRLIFVPLEVNLQAQPEELRRPAFEVEAEHRAEAAGILNWLVDGWRDYKAQGLALPERWSALRDRLLEGADPVGQFMRELTEPAPDAEPSARIPRGDFNRAFAAWAEEEGGSAWSSKAVNDAMTEAGHITRKYRGIVAWPGLRWQAEALPFLERVLGRRPAPPEAAPEASQAPPAAHEPPPF